ncbi:MAG: serine/threonine protein kinase [Actinobacteria bacterium]|nr:serine/threonine protein kinase [Actinomycetota bacterium]
MVGFPAIGDRIGAYRVDAEIGRGGMGIVYRATQLALDRPVALKILDPLLSADPSFVARFTREASILAGLDSPHIVQIHDHGEADGRLYLAMQYVGGGDLSRLIEQDGPLPPLAALQIFTQVVEALGDAHTHGIVHRDVKPSNVLLRADASEPFAYLCDFGIARTEESGLTRTGTVAGTWAFMSPETHTGSPATPRSDLYSAACVLWAMLTGRNPYSGTDVQVAMAHVQSPVPQLPGSDPLIVALNRLLWACLAKDPDDRPDTAAEVLALTRGALAPAEGVSPLSVSKPDSGIFRRASIPTAPVGPVVPTPTRGRRSTRWILAGAALVVAVAVTVTALNLSGALPRPGAVPSPVPTTPGTPTATALTYQCWNGDEVPALADCTAPAGREALRYLYPSLDAKWDDCAYNDAARAGTETYECVDEKLGLIRYRYWDDSDAATAHYLARYAKAKVTRMILDGTDVGVIYTLDKKVRGVYSLSGFWLDAHFSFSVESPTIARRDALFTQVELRALAQISGHPTGADVQVGRLE